MKTINAINAFSRYISIELKGAHAHPNAAWMKRQERRKSRRVQEADLAKNCYDGIQREFAEFVSVVPAVEDKQECGFVQAIEPTVFKAVTVIRKRLFQRRVVETIQVPA